MSTDSPQPPALPIGLDGIVERFDHLALAVRSIGEVLPLVELLGGSYINGGHHPTQGFRWAQFALPSDMKLELLAPIDPADQDHFLVRFLEGRGEGPHHVTFKVANVEEAVAEASARGFSVVQQDYSDPGWKEAFVHPGSAHGLLIQLAQWDEALPLPTRPIEDVLADPS